jgi:hypothetical protein
LDYVYQEALAEFQAGEKVNKFVRILINNELEEIVDDFFKKGQQPGFENPSRRV